MASVCTAVLETRSRRPDHPAPVDPEAVVLAACQAMLAEGIWPDNRRLYQKLCFDGVGFHRAGRIRDRLVADGMLPADARSEARRLAMAQYSARCKAQRQARLDAEIAELEAVFARQPKTPPVGLTPEHDARAKAERDKGLCGLRSSQHFKPAIEVTPAAAARKAVREFRAAYRSVISLLSCCSGVNPDGDRDADRARAEQPRRGSYHWTHR